MTYPLKDNYPVRAMRIMKITTAITCNDDFIGDAPRPPKTSIATKVKSNNPSTLNSLRSAHLLALFFGK